MAFNVSHYSKEQVPLRTHSSSSTDNSPTLGKLCARIIDSVSKTVSPLLLRHTLIFDSGTSDKDPRNERTSSIFEVDVFRGRSDVNNQAGDIYDKKPMRKPSVVSKVQKDPEHLFRDEYDVIETETISDRILAIVNSRQISDEAYYEDHDQDKVNESYMSALYSERFCLLSDVIEKTTSTELNVMYGSEELREYNEDEGTLNNDDMHLYEADWNDLSRFAEGTIHGRTCSPDLMGKYEDRGISIASVDLKLNYELSSEKLKVHILRVMDVTDLRDNNKLIDSFLKLSIYQREGEKKKRTKVAKRLRDPKFDETFEFDRVGEKWLHITCLRVQLYQKKLFKTHCLGDALIWLDDYDVEEEEDVTLTELFQPALVADSHLFIED